MCKGDGGRRGGNTPAAVRRLRPRLDLLDLVPGVILDAVLGRLGGFPSVPSIADPRVRGRRRRFIWGEGGTSNRICLECVKGCREGQRACHDSDDLAIEEALWSEGAFVRTCHMGFHEVVAPVRVGDEVIAVVFVGQLTVDGHPGRGHLAEGIRRFRPGFSDATLDRFLGDLPVVTGEQFEELRRETEEVARALSQIASDRSSQMRVELSLRRLRQLLREERRKDRKTVYRAVVREVLKNAPAGRATVYEWVEEKRGLTLVVQRGPKSAKRHRFLPLHASARGGITNRAFTSDKPQCVPDVREDPDYLETWPEVCSELCVPYHYAGRPVGVIDIESRALAAFSDEDTGRVAPFAEFLGEVYAQDHEARRLEAMRRLGEAVNAQHPSLAKVSRVILNGALRLANARTGAVHTWDEKEKCLRVLAARNLPTSYRKSTLAVAAEPRGVTNRALAERATQVVPDVREDPDYVPLVPGTRSEIAVPLICRDEPIGVLNLEATETKWFTADDARVLGAYAVHAASAIDKVRLLDAARKRAEAWEFLTKALGRLSTEADLAAVLRDIAGQATRVVRARLCYVFLRIAGTKTAILKAASTGFEDLVDAVTYQEGEGFTGRILSGGEPKILNPPKGRRLWERKLKKCFRERTGERVRSILGVPIQYEDRTIGAIVAINRSPQNGSRCFVEADLDLLLYLSRAVGTTVARAQLRREVDCQEEVYKGMLGGSDVPTSQKAAEAILGALRTARPRASCAVFLRDPGSNVLVCVCAHGCRPDWRRVRVDLSRPGPSIIKPVVSRGRLVSRPSVRLRTTTVSSSSPSLPSSQ